MRVQTQTLTDTYEFYGAFNSHATTHPVLMLDPFSIVAITGEPAVADYTQRDAWSQRITIHLVSGTAHPLWYTLDDDGKNMLGALLSSARKIIQHSNAGLR